MRVLNRQAAGVSMRLCDDSAMSRQKLLPLCTTPSASEQEGHLMRPESHATCITIIISTGSAGGSIRKSPSKGEDVNIADHIIMVSGLDDTCQKQMLYPYFIV